GVGLERHGAHTPVKFDLPSGLPARQINDRSNFVFDRAADRALAIRRNVHVVHAAVHGNAFHSLELTCVDDIHGAGFRVDSDEHAASILGDGHVIATHIKRYFVQNFASLAINGVEHGLRFIADIHTRPIGGESD